MIFSNWQHPNAAILRDASFFNVDNIKHEAILSETSSMFARDNVKNAILRHFYNFELDNIQKLKQFCEISSIFELDNIINKAILRDLLQK